MNVFLIIAGVLSATAALLHVGCIYYGAPWYRFFGAGEGMAMLAEKGSIKPTLITSGIVLVLSIWSIYAFSAAGVNFKLPFIRFVLIGMASVYLLRGVAGLLLIKSPMGRSPGFWLWSSIICLLFALVHFIGIGQQWANL